MNYSEFLEWLNKLTVANSKNKNLLKQGERTISSLNTTNEPGLFSYFKIIPEVMKENENILTS